MFNIAKEEPFIVDGSGNQQINSLMVAKTEGSELAFQNIGALLHFVVSATGEGVGGKLYAIEVVSDKPLSGSMSANFVGSSCNVTAPTGEADTVRTLTFSTPMELTASTKDVYLWVPPVSNGNRFRLRYVIETSAGEVKVFDLTLNSSYSFNRGTIYSFPTNQFKGTAMGVEGSADQTAVVLGASADKPLLVTSQEAWNYLADNKILRNASKYVALANDINVNSHGSCLKASLDGCGHTITLATNISLFDSVYGATVRNLTINASGVATGPTHLVNGATRLFGFLADYAENATIQNCVNKASYSCELGSGSPYVGGLFGRMKSSSLDNCINEGNITSDAYYLGGVVGRSNSTVAIQNCVNKGDISYSSSISGNIVCLGGIAGEMNTQSASYTIQNCSNQGTITLSGTNTNDQFIGGLFGIIKCNISNCSNIATISCSETQSNNKYIGGIIGKHEVSTECRMYNCFNEGDIQSSGTTKMFVGGLIGLNQYMHVTNCYVYSDLQGNSVSGIVYKQLNLWNNTYIQNCYYYTADANTDINGICGDGGSSYKFHIDHCYYPSVCTSFMGNNCVDDGNNKRLTNATTTEDNESLCDLLNGNLVSLPVTGRRWAVSGGRVVFE